MKICFATWMLEPAQGRALTKQKAKHRLLSYFHTTEKADQFQDYALTGLNDLLTFVKRNYEVWKDIKGFPGYKISNLGRVQSFIGRSPRILKQGATIHGRKYAGLHTNGDQFSKPVHSLVINHFGPPKPSPKHECNHKDGDKINNWWTNLEWMTKKENMKHAADNKLMKHGEDHHFCKLTEKQVIRIRKLYKSKNYTQDKLAKRFNISQNEISKIIRKVRWKHTI